MSEYDELLDRYYELPIGCERIAVLEELIRLADSNSHVEAAYQFRRELTSTCIHEGFPEKGIVAFSWCMSQFDKNPELDDWHDLLWQYKTILELIPVFATVSRDQIVRMQEDMATRLSHFGETERTAHYYRSWNFMRMGDNDIALQHQETYLRMARTGISDCKACERDRQVELLTRMHHDQDALALAEPIMKGKMTCSEVPEFTNGHIVKSQLRLGQIEEATERQQRGYAKIRNDRKYLGTIGDLLLVVIRNRDFDAGMAQVSRHLPWAAECAAGELKFRFYSAVALFFEALSFHQPGSLKLRLPRELECFSEDELYAPANLSSWFSAQTKSLADQFNARNGNDAYTRMLAEHRELCELS